MKKISHFDPYDFLEFILSKLDFELDGEYVNYKHTHIRVHYDPKSGRLHAEEICNNGEGSTFGLNQYADAIIPTEWNEFLPKMLLIEPNWIDVPM